MSATLLSMITIAVCAGLLAYGYDMPKIWKNNDPLSIHAPSVLDLNDLSDPSVVEFYEKNFVIFYYEEYSKLYDTIKKNIGSQEDFSPLVLVPSYYFAVYDIVGSFWLAFLLVLGHVVIATVTTLIVKTFFTSHYQFNKTMDDIEKEFKRTDKLPTTDYCMMNYYIISTHYNYLMAIKKETKKRKLVRYAGYAIGAIYFLYVITNYIH